MEVGRDTLEVMGERSRAHQLAQQVANMTQQLAAQRCVSTFLGSNEQSLREEIANLRKVCPCQATVLVSLAGDWSQEHSPKIGLL